MRPALSILSLLVAMAAGCASSPPQPPQPDEWSRRPANTPAAVELQICRSNLQNTRIVANEASRAAQTAGAHAAFTRGHPAPEASGAANEVHTLLFGFGSSRLALPPNARHVVEAARDAPLVVLRGRTDGARESFTESRMARERTAAVQAWLVRAGVDPSRIRATWQPVGDTAADNATDAGRALNRRVEIEIYRSAPRFFAAGSPANP